MYSDAIEHGRFQMFRTQGPVKSMWPLLTVTAFSEQLRVAYVKL